MALARYGWYHQTRGWVLLANGGLFNDHPISNLVVACLSISTETDVEGQKDFTQRNTYWRFTQQQQSPDIFLRSGRYPISGEAVGRLNGGGRPT